MLDVHPTLMRSGPNSVLEVFVYISLAKLTLHIINDWHNPVHFRVKNFSLLKTIESYAFLHVLLLRTGFISVHQRRLNSLVIFGSRWERTLEKVIFEQRLASCWLESLRSGLDEKFLLNLNLIFLSRPEIRNGWCVLCFHTIGARRARIQNHLRLCCKYVRFPRFWFVANGHFAVFFYKLRFEIYLQSKLKGLMLLRLCAIFKL
jgi:hypothetical protein